MTDESLVVLERIKRVRGLLFEGKDDAIVIRDTHDLRWLTGCAGVFDDEEAHCALITDNDLFFHTDSRYYNAFVEKMDPALGWKLDMERVSVTTWIAQKLTEAHCNNLLIADSSTLAFADSLRTSFVSASLPILYRTYSSEILEMRSVKDATEIELMRRAQSITDDAFTHICNFIEPGMTEMRIKVELDNYMLTHGATGLAFETIVAAGANSANPHAIAGSTVVKTGDVVLMDYGAAYQDYNSDMTRCVVVGQASAKQRDVFDTVRIAHESAASFIGPGVVARTVHELAADIIADAGYGDKFGHGLGHGVGVAIHERPNLNPVDEHVLEAGHVVTDEPGIYLPGEFGFRLEDFGVVTQSGFEPFTTSTHELVIV